MCKYGTNLVVFWCCVFANDPSCQIKCIISVSKESVLVIMLIKLCCLRTKYKLTIKKEALLLNYQCETVVRTILSVICHI